MFNNKTDLLDPLSVIVKLFIYSYKTVGTKISIKNNKLSKCSLAIDIRLIHADCVYALHGNRMLIYNSQLKPIANCKLVTDILDITVHRKNSINITFVSGPNLYIDLDIS